MLEWLNLRRFWLAIRFILIDPLILFYTYTSVQINNYNMN